MASPVQEVAPMTIEPVCELTLVPPSPRRASLDLASCAGESAPLQLTEVSAATSGAAVEGHIVVQGEELGADEASEHYEATTPDGMGDEGPSTAKREEPVFNEQSEEATPDDMTEGVGSEGSSTSQGEEPGVDETQEQSEAIVPDEVVEVLVLESSEVEIRSGLEGSGDLGFEVAPPKAVTTMPIVSSTRLL
ncbi:hypothetical protein AMTR_s00167p00022840 [Amborella trichopoda]|uniref:Uncharacterized protein n=1 Tax=Amborella trichopoda TaxID=13333 RepID=W1PS57_AMBTC|nr:hypothetical protein AMTR_s00167p00022840 [Amborella trichopoda]